jgi:hypothetical protein
MTQAQARVQECLVVFARSVEVLHQSPKARAIEVKENGPNVVPSWRGILATDHGHEPFDEGFVRERLGSLKIHDFRKGADWSDQRCRPASPLIWSSARLAASAAGANPRAPSQAPRGTPDID